LHANNCIAHSYSFLSLCVDSSVFSPSVETMKEIADWIREWTPGWSDETRYKWIATVHSWLPPVCLILFVFTDAVVIRFFTLCLLLVTLVSEFALRDCIVTMVEREFSDSNWDDLFAKTFKALGWEVTRSEKMTFNIGLNSGLLIMISMVLLRQSVLWVVGFTGIAVSALPSLVLLSNGLRLPQIESTLPL
jgi:hypothetical protein